MSSFFNLGGGGDSTTSNYNDNRSWNQTYTSTISDFLGTNNSVLNLGAGSSSYTTRELAQQFRTDAAQRNDNIADLTGGAGGAGGGFALDAAASVGVSTGSGNASGGQVDKQGGGTFSDLGAQNPNGVSLWLWWIFGGGILLVGLIWFIKRRK